MNSKAWDKDLNLIKQLLNSYLNFDTERFEKESLLNDKKIDSTNNSNAKFKKIETDALTKKNQVFFKSLNKEKNIFNNCSVFKNEINNIFLEMEKKLTDIKQLRIINEFSINNNNKLGIDPIYFLNKLTEDSKISNKKFIKLYIQYTSNNLKNIKFKKNIFYIAIIFISILITWIVTNYYFDYWDGWQSNMSRDFLKTMQLDEATRNSSEHIIIQWNKFLENYKDNNLLSQQDENYRKDAQERIEYWEKPEFLRNAKPLIWNPEINAYRLPTSMAGSYIKFSLDGNKRFYAPGLTKSTVKGFAFEIVEGEIRISGSAALWQKGDKPWLKAGYHNLLGNGILKIRPY